MNRHAHDSLIARWLRQPLRRLAALLGIFTAEQATAVPVPPVDSADSVGSIAASPVVEPSPEPLETALVTTNGAEATEAATPAEAEAEAEAVEADAAELPARGAGRAAAVSALGTCSSPDTDRAPGTDPRGPIGREGSSAAQPDTTAAAPIPASITTAWIDCGMGTLT